MDTIKIGKFIAENRKKNEMTQAQLGEKIGVTAKTISRWENGNYMPDISLLKPLSEELGISLNDLLSGETVDKEDYQNKFEENILNTIDYTNKKTNEKNKLFGWLFLIIGIICTMSAMTIFPSESSWGSIYSIIGVMIAVIGVAKLTKSFKYIKRLLICALFIVSSLCFLIGIDYVGVVNMHQAPRFTTSVITTWVNSEEIIYYNGPFYDVIRYHVDTDAETFKVIKNKKVSDATIIEHFEATNEDNNNGNIDFQMSIDN